MCYWTTPLLIHTAKDCANGAALNAGTIDANPIVDADLKRPFEGLSLQTCHQMCQETADCQMFKYKSTATITCHLMKNGACTASTSAVADTNIYAKT
jgi:hypothetical protein